MTIDQSTMLDDRYRLDERIGTGGMADVYRATDEVLGRQVAVKVLREVTDPLQRTRFIDEARTLAGLDHPGLITLLDAGIRGERPYLVMTLVEDATLSARISVGPLDSDEVAALGAQVARALAYAHGQGVVHRDVKPSNVLLCGDGRALLADFGIARLVGATEHHTRTGDAIGSPAYLSPEQVTGEELTPALDIYSLGLVLLESLTAQRAYPGTPVEAAVARLNAAPAIPDSLSPEWRELIQQMTHRVPENRPNAVEVADLLSSTPFEGTGTAFRQAQRTPDESEVEHTAVLELGALDAAATTGAAPYVDGPVERATTYLVDPAHTRNWLWWQIGVLAVISVAIVIALVVLLNGGNDTKSDNGIPANVPAQYQGPLSDLHDALNGAAR
ncbi:serine/threonine-protein kinase [Nocardioides marmorisolisilvae]|uniref:non-specific serine/threonine protein kinase n=1 Tax=Nocardioides marmorisolisilvae TaxID=1542737 RepID=A0A3N0DSW7_9ACTN|nr:serine/threonine-protein kinase [Nocardioides marmorisolisilvae]RNL78493.1 serine/threonine protein kinase [Nocardioides marmorisolisilvae]